MRNHFKHRTQEDSSTKRFAKLSGANSRHTGAEPAVWQRGCRQDYYEVLALLSAEGATQMTQMPQIVRRY